MSLHLRHLLKPTTRNYHLNNNTTLRRRRTTKNTMQLPRPRSLPNRNLLTRNVRRLLLQVKTKQHTFRYGSVVSQNIRPTRPHATRMILNFIKDSAHRPLLFMPKQTTIGNPPHNRGDLLYRVLNVTLIQRRLITSHMSRPLVLPRRHVRFRYYRQSTSLLSYHSMVRCRARHNFPTGGLGGVKD